MKEIKILVVTVLTLIIILVLKISGISIFQKGMNEQEIRKLINNGISYENLYYIQTDNEGKKTEKFIKYNIMVVKNEEMYSWQNLDTMK